MAAVNVFLCYSHADAEWLARLKVHLKPVARGGVIDYWDDTRITTGQRWRDEIQKALNAAQVAILLISSDFYASDFIEKHELPPLLEAASKRRVLVIGLQIGASRFSRDEVLSVYQTVNHPDAPIESLTKHEQEKLFDDLVEEIEQHIGKQATPSVVRKAVDQQAKQTTPTSFEPNRGRCGPDQVSELNGWDGLTLPCFFRSVSSHETQLEPDAALKALRLMKAPAVLISAYDLARDPRSNQMVSEVKRLRKEGCLVLMDSGNYEAMRKQSPRATKGGGRKQGIGKGKRTIPHQRDWTVSEFRQILKLGLFDYAFCYDRNNNFTTPEELVEDTIDRVRRDNKLLNEPERLLPIVHAPGNPSRGYDSELIPAAIRMTAEQLKPRLIAVPERELGDGIWARVRTVKAIRKELEKLAWYQPLHLLGTGNFISVALFVAAGADFFDGLEWCRTVVDPETAFLHHHQHFDFFSEDFLSSRNASSGGKGDTGVSYHAKMAIHNLEFIDEWMAGIQAAKENDAMGSFLLEAFRPLPGHAVESLLSNVPEIIS